MKLLGDWSLSILLGQIALWLNSQVKGGGEARGTG